MLCLGQPCVYGFYPRLSVCLISQKPMQLDLTYKCTSVGPGNPFILGSKCQRSRSRITKTGPTWVVFALVWVLASSFHLSTLAGTCFHGWPSSGPPTNSARAFNWKQGPPTRGNHSRTGFIISLFTIRLWERERCFFYDASTLQRSKIVQCRGMVTTKITLLPLK